MGWAIEQTNLFESKFERLIPLRLKEEVKKQILKLSENPYGSKPLGYKFFREKKIEKWRIYFLIYEYRLVLYFIDVSDKKLQQETIDKIKSEFRKFKEYIDSKYPI